MEGEIQNPKPREFLGCVWFDRHRHQCSLLYQNRDGHTELTVGKRKAHPKELIRLILHSPSRFYTKNLHLFVFSFTGQLVVARATNSSESGDFFIRTLNKIVPLKRSGRVFLHSQFDQYQVQFVS